MFSSRSMEQTKHISVGIHAIYMAMVRLRLVSGHHISGFLISHVMDQCAIGQFHPIDTANAMAHAHHTYGTYNNLGFMARSEPYVQPYIFHGHPAQQLRIGRQPQRFHRQRYRLASPCRLRIHSNCRIRHNHSLEKKRKTKKQQNKQQTDIPVLCHCFRSNIIRNGTNTGRTA